MSAPLNNFNSLGVLLNAAEYIFTPDQQIPSVIISSNMDQTGRVPMSLLSTEGLYLISGEQEDVPNVEAYIYIELSRVQ